MNNLKTKIFLDGGIPQETKEMLDLLGFLDGQTTNPTLITKNPAYAVCVSGGKKCTSEDAWMQYKDIVDKISHIIEGKSVSIEVYADSSTKAEEMIEKGRELFSWIPYAHIKLPITDEGLKAAEVLTGEGKRVNMTLCFTQEQAAAVYAATRGAKTGDVFVSPFVGRLDDRGDNGLSLIKNILHMYEAGDQHVEVLVASVRSLDHFLGAIAVGADIITSPVKILTEWKDGGLHVPDENFQYDAGELADIPYVHMSLEKEWSAYNIKHELTDMGIERFAHDWNNLLGNK